MFNYPGTELFRADERRVVWSQEEYEAALAEGWSEEKPAAPPIVEQVPVAEPPAPAEAPVEAPKKRK